MKLLAALALLLAPSGPASAAAAQHWRWEPAAIIYPEAIYPEGPQLTPNGVLVAEMAADRVSLVTPEGGRPVWSMRDCGPTSIKKIPSGGYWILCHLGGYVMRVDDSFRTVRKIMRTESNEIIDWPNDGSVDSAGDLYLSSSGIFNLKAPATGRVIFISAATNRATVVARGIRYSNGVRVDEDRRRVLVSEHLNGQVLSFPLERPGKLGKPSLFFRFASAPEVRDPYDQSGPDGIAILPGGDIMVADYGNGRLLMLTGNGQFISEVKVALPFVTNMAISPATRQVYVTTTRSNAEAVPHGVVQVFRLVETQAPAR